MAQKDSEIRRLSLPLTQGLRVRHIAHFGLTTCRPEEVPAEVLLRTDLLEFDQIPIAEADSIIGILERESGERRRIDASVLVSADEPLAHFLPTVKDQKYRLVVDGTQITGIVTWSDLLKLPVLLLGYSLIAQLERLLARAICARYRESDDWIRRLTSKQQKALTQKAQRAKQDNLSLPLIEFVDLPIKATLVRDLLLSQTGFEIALENVRLFRNDVAHAHRIMRGHSELKVFVDRIETVIEWIQSLEQHLSSEQGGAALA